jgi:hypothetical protein
MTDTPKEYAVACAKCGKAGRYDTERAYAGNDQTVDEASPGTEANELIFACSAEHVAELAGPKRLVVDFSAPIELEM